MLGDTVLRGRIMPAHRTSCMDCEPRFAVVHKQQQEFPICLVEYALGNRPFLARSVPEFT
jgi:hypothetical protein